MLQSSVARGRNVGPSLADAPQRRGVPVLDSSRRVQLKRAGDAPQVALTWKRAAGGGLRNHPRGFTDVCLCRNVTEPERRHFLITCGAAAWVISPSKQTQLGSRWFLGALMWHCFT